MRGWVRPFAPSTFDRSTGNGDADPRGEASTALCDSARDHGRVMRRLDSCLLHGRNKEEFSGRGASTLFGGRPIVSP